MKWPIKMKKKVLKRAFFHYPHYREALKHAKLSRHVQMV